MWRLGLGRSWAHVAFLSSGGAAAVHLAAARPHLEEWAPAGAFMLAGGLAQMGWALWILSDQRDQVVAAGVLLNAGTVALWLVSRTVGLPIGPTAGMAEHVHATDALATALEIAAVVSALAIVAEARPHRAFAILAGITAACAVVTTAHDHAREGATAAAALALVLVSRVLVVSVPRREEARRSDVYEALVRRYVIGLGGARRARLGHSGSGAH